MSTSTLQLLPTTATEIAQLDPATLASIPGVAYDLKRLKVYSSCLRCRAKKVKCDRKEPCSRCEKHSVECSYRELASVQLDIRQFQRHLTNPKIRKDGAGIITSTATPIITLPSGDTAVLSPSTTAAATLIAAAKATALTSNSDGCAKKAHADRKFNKGSSTSSSASPSTPSSPIDATGPSRFGTESNSSTDTESDAPTRVPLSKSAAMARAKVNKIQRRKVTAPVIVKRVQPEFHMQHQADDDDDDEEEEEIERLVLRDDYDSAHYSYDRSHAQADVHMSSESEEDESNANVPIWHAQAMGKHKQTAHEQDLAETFGLAAYLKAKEMESGVAGQSIDYDIELERALAQRMPTSFSRPDRSLSRARKYAQAGYNPSLPYARPAYCQLSSSNNAAALPPAAHCCCQIAAKQGQAPGTCYFSGNTNRASTVVEESSMSPPPQAIGYEHGETARIAYSPSYQPSYTPKDASATSADDVSIKPEWSVSSSSSNTYSSMMPPPPLAPLRKLDIQAASSASSTPLPSPRIELPPIYLPKLPAHHPTTPASSDLSRFQVGREGDADKPPLEIACKYNEPNVDAWDMIEKPLSRTVPVTTKRGRSVKMEMGWILS
ncbi:hypothetical protein EDD11_009339 [Mortierella claussenii]|nr:hypothetical protein EDD11_009339 [Mortierella claussenii]